MSNSQQGISNIQGKYTKIWSVGNSLLDVAAHQRFGFGNGNEREILGHGMLETGDRHRECQGRLKILLQKQAAQQTGRKPVAAAHPVHDRIQVVGTIGSVSRLRRIAAGIAGPVVEHGPEPVATGRKALAHGQRHPLDPIRLGRESPRNLGLPLRTRLRSVGFRHPHTENVLGLPPVGNQQIDMRQDAPQRLAGQSPGRLWRIPAPERSAIVDVHADLQSAGLGAFAGFHRQIGAVARQSRRCAGKMKPVLARKPLVPGYATRDQLGKGAVRAVVDDLGRALRGTGLQIEQAQPAAATQNAFRPHTVGAKGVDAGVADFVGRHGRDQMRIQAPLSHGDRDIGLRSRIARGKLAGLHEALEPARIESQQQLAEKNRLRSPHAPPSFPVRPPA